MPFVRSGQIHQTPCQTMLEIRKRILNICRSMIRRLRQFGGLFGCQIVISMSVRNNIMPYHYQQWQHKRDISDYPHTIKNIECECNIFIPNFLTLMTTKAKDWSLCFNQRNVVASKPILSWTSLHVTLLKSRLPCLLCDFAGGSVVQMTAAISVATSTIALSD